MAVPVKKKHWWREKELRFTPLNPKQMKDLFLGVLLREKITNVLVFGKDYIHTSIMSSKLWLSEFSPFGFLFGFSRLLFSYEIISFIDIKVIHNVWRLGGENGQFRHNRGIKCIIGNEISQNEITGTQTSFSAKFGDKRSFFPFSCAPSLPLYKFSLPPPVQLL